MRDLTKGSIFRLIILFALPLLLGNLFQLLYNLSDTRIVGQFIGRDAIAAVGATSSLNTVIVGFLNGLTSGFALVTARFFGAKDLTAVRRSIAHCLMLGVATAVVLTAASLIMLDPLLRALNTPESIFPQAKAYISVILGGMVISMLYNVCAACLRAVGDTVSPLIFLIIAAVTNIGLDLLFILAFKTGVEGAAYATLIAQGLSVALCVIYIFRRHRILVPTKADLVLDGKLAGDMYASGTSMGLMISLVGIGSLIMQGAINIFGEQIIVAHTAARKLSEMYMLTISVLGAASANISGQNYGAGDISRVKECVIKATLITWIWSAAVVVVTWLFTPQLTRLVTGLNDMAVISTVTRYMKFNTVCYFILGIVIVFRNSLQGIGSKIAPIVSSLVELAGKFAVAWYLAPKMGYDGIIISEPVVWAGMAVVLGVSFFTNRSVRSGKIYCPSDVMKKTNG